MSTTVTLVIMLIAMAAFAVITVRRTSVHDQDDPAAPAQDQLRGFVYVGSAAAVLLGLVVLVIFVGAPTRWWAGTVALLGFFGYCLYLGIAFVLYRRATTARLPDRGPRHRRGDNDPDDAVTTGDP